MPRGPRKGWFEVDRSGLSKLLQQRGKAFVLHELIQNAWDQNITRVDVEFREVPNQPAATISVSDDDPSGFQDLNHAFTLFAESPKKGDPEKRGRFNIGEKLVLALCSHASITSASGTVEFQPDGTRRKLRRERAVGSEFRGELRITREEYRETLCALQKLIPPEGSTTYINGVPLSKRAPVRIITAPLPTIVADMEGILRKAIRKTPLRLFEPQPGEVPTIYEMGIPVVETEDRWHVDVGQKVPLNMDRDNVSPSYLRELRTMVLNEMHDAIPKEDANSVWIQQALRDQNVNDAAVKAVVHARFGDRCVSYDPSDAEANSRAVANGYTLVHGGMLGAEQWKNVRRAGALLPAGQVFPTPKPYGDGPPEKVVDPGEWTDEMHATARYARTLAEHLLGITISVRICDEPRVNWQANFGCATLTLNLGKLGMGWFMAVASEEMNRILLHELAHQHASNHLSEDYHDALCRLGAKLTTLALVNPETFEPHRYLPVSKTGEPV